MDIHTRIVGVLHILAAAFVLLIVGTVSLFFGVATSFIETTEFPFNLLMAMGSAVLGLFAFLSLAQIVAAAMLLQGRTGARPWVIAFGVLHLFNVPFGTALGVYTLWALLRDQPIVIVQPPR